MPSKSLSVRLIGINSASNGINGGTGCNFIFLWTEYNYIDQSVVCVAYSFHMTYKYTLLKSGFLQLGDIAPWGHWIIVGPYEMIITFEPP